MFQHALWAQIMCKSVITPLYPADGLPDKLTQRAETSRSNRGEKVHLQPLLSFQRRPVHQQDLECQVVPEDQPNLLDQDLLCLPGEVTPISDLQYIKQYTGHNLIICVSYPLSKNTIFAWWAIRSCRALRTGQKTLRQL